MCVCEVQVIEWNLAAHFLVHVRIRPSAKIPLFKILALFQQFLIMLMPPPEDNAVFSVGSERELFGKYELSLSQGAHLQVGFEHCVPELVCH